MRISDWSSDVCSSDLQPPSSVSHAPLSGKRCAASGSVATTERAPAAATALRGIADEHQLRHSGAVLTRQSQIAAMRLLPLRGQSVRRIALCSMPPVGLAVFQSYAVRSEEHTSELQSLMRISY